METFKRRMALVAIAALVALMPSVNMLAQPAEGAKPTPATDTAAVVQAADSLQSDSLQSDSTEAVVDDLIEEAADDASWHQTLKTKFIDGNAAFMSLVALVLILGLTLCIERIIYLTLSEVNARKLTKDIGDKVAAGDIEGARELCRNTRGPVASICYQALLRQEEPMDEIERSIVSYGSVQSARMERGCSWISLFITMAPALGFLGTVIGMVMAFDQIQQAGDISPTIVASGMKVALITTIFGIIVALILQLFYNFVLTKIERITMQMEEAAVEMLDMIAERKNRQ